MLAPPKATGGQDEHNGHGHRRWKSPGSRRVGISFLVHSFMLLKNGRPVFEPPAVVINPRMAIDYWLGWSSLIFRT
jgi:hypothetical protein